MRYTWSKMFDRQRFAMLVGAVVAVACDFTPVFAPPFEASDEPILAHTAMEPELEPMSGQMVSVPEAEPPPPPPPVLRTVAPQRTRKALEQEEPPVEIVRGTVLAHGGGPIRDVTMEQFAQLCGDGRMVLIPTAAQAAEHGSYRSRVRKPWLRQGIRDVMVLHARDREQADEGFAEPLRKASCAWLSGGAQGRLEDRYVGTPVEQELHALLRRGGAVGGDSAGSAIMSRVMIHHGNPEPVEGTGFGILPGIIVDQHFVVREREPRLVTMVERHPDLVGFGIDESTALLVQGNHWKVIGDSVVRRCTANEGCADLPAGASGRFPLPPE